MFRRTRTPASYYEDGRWKTGRATFRWVCECGAKSRVGSSNRSDMEWLAIAHRLRQDIRENHSTEITKELG